MLLDFIKNLTRKGKELDKNKPQILDNAAILNLNALWKKDEPFEIQITNLDGSQTPLLKIIPNKEKGVVEIEKKTNAILDKNLEIPFDNRHANLLVLEFYNLNYEPFDSISQIWIERVDIIKLPLNSIFGTATEVGVINPVIYVRTDDGLGGISEGDVEDFIDVFTVDEEDVILVIEYEVADEYKIEDEISLDDIVAINVSEIFKAIITKNGIKTSIDTFKYISSLFKLVGVENYNDTTKSIVEEFAYFYNFGEFHRILSIRFSYLYDVANDLSVSISIVDAKDRSIKMGSLRRSHNLSTVEVSFLKDLLNRNLLEDVRRFKRLVAEYEKEVRIEKAPLLCVISQKELGELIPERIIILLYKLSHKFKKLGAENLENIRNINIKIIPHEQKYFYTKINLENSELNIIIHTYAKDNPAPALVKINEQDKDKFINFIKDLIQIKF